MRVLLRAWLLPLTVLLVSFLLPGVARAAPHVTLSQLALRLSDLPAGTQRDSARYWTNVPAAARDHVPLTAYRRHGRELSYTERFHRLLTGDRMFVSGIDLASSQLTVFRTAGGARWQYQRLVPRLAHSVVVGATTAGTKFGQASHPFPYHVIAVPKIGEQDACFAANWAEDEFAHVMRVLIFRQGRFVLVLHLDGIEGRSPLRDVLRVAGRIEGRIQRIYASSRYLSWFTATSVAWS